MPSRKFWLLSLQATISLALLGYLGYHAWRDKTFTELAAAPKDVTPLVLAWFAALGATVVTLLRWWVLVHALGMPLTPREALRIGFVAYFLNVLGLGIVGGDTLKAVFLGRRTRGRRAEAVTSIVLDRVLGLYVLVCMSAVGLALANLETSAETGPVISNVGKGAQLCAALGTVGLGLLFAPGLANAPFWDRLAKTPVVGGILGQLVAAARIYRRKIWHLLAATVMSVAVHALYILMFYLLAGGLSMERPSLASHVVIVPPSMVAGTLPIGAQEVVMDALYRAALPSAGRHGFVLILAYRVIQILIAGVGIAFYLAGKREVDRLLERPDAPPEEDGVRAERGS